MVQENRSMEFCVWRGKQTVSHACFACFASIVLCWSWAKEYANRSTGSYQKSGGPTI